MDELLQHLEHQIKQLIGRHDSLKCSHQQINQSKHLLIREKQTLLAKQQKAILQIESLLSRLKAIEDYHER